MLILNGAPQRKSVDIVVVGDCNTGKTSLITTLVSSIFPESVPKVLQQVRVPPEEAADNIALSITDTSSALDDRLATLKQVSLADAVILVYSAEKRETFDRLRSYWLPEIFKVYKGPIVVVGNKSDLIDKSHRRDDPEKLLREFPGGQIDGCWKNCSAKLNINVSDVFSMAQQAVVYPIAPLFDTQTQELRPNFKTALLRVFRIFDQDRDGVLSDVELNDFQETCFGARLQPSDIEELRSMLQGEGPGRVSASGGITFEGYLSVHRKFIQRNRAETSWLVLRQFGYSDSLELLVPNIVLSDGKNDSVVRDQSMELTKRSMVFFADLFHQFDKDKDQALSPKELNELFSICPGGLSPWAALQQQEDPSNDSSSPTAVATSSSSTKKTTELFLAMDVLLDETFGPSNSVLSDLADFPRGVKTDTNGNVTLAGWLAQWSMITLLQPRLTLLYLYFLGFDRSKEEAIMLTRKRSVENEDNNLQRNVVRAFVFGAHGSGKNSLLEALNSGPGQPGSLSPSGANNTNSLRPNDSAFTFNSAYQDAGKKPSRTSTWSACARIKVLDQSKQFVLTSVSAEHDILEKALSKDMVDCDLAVMMFDSTNPSSLDLLVRLQKRIPESVPCVYIANKVDLLTSGDYDGESQAIEEATMLCVANSLPHPEEISLLSTNPSLFKQKTRLFELLMTAALRPDAARPISEQRRAIQRRNRLLRATLRISLVSTITLGSVYLLYTLVVGSSSSSSSSGGSTNESEKLSRPDHSQRLETENFRKLEF